MSATYDQLVTCDQCVAAMLDDPILADDLLLIGLHWARAVHLGTPPLDGIGKSTARAVYGTGGSRRVWDIIHTDIRRYVPDTSMAARCQRPIRRNQAQIKEHGETCGHPTCGEAHRALFVDPADGTRHSIGCCSTPRCVTWWTDLRARNQAELAAHCPRSLLRTTVESSRSTYQNSIGSGSTALSIRPGCRRTRNGCGGHQS